MLVGGALERACMHHACSIAHAMCHCWPQRLLLLLRALPHLLISGLPD